jgi:predicted phosphoribosyltransferase
VLGVEVAEALGMPLDLVIPRKIGHPRQPEYAIAAVAESGELASNAAEVERLDRQWFRDALAREQAEARRRRVLYLAGRAPLALHGRVAIVVDDGIATGLTMQAAIRDVRRRVPATLVVAVPVAPADTLVRLAREVDAVVTLAGGEGFLGAVGAYYEQFPQVDDAEVVALLKRAATAAAPAT